MHAENSSEAWELPLSSNSSLPPSQIQPWPSQCRFSIRHHCRGKHLNSNYYQISTAALPCSLNHILGTRTRRADPGIRDHKMALKKVPFPFYNPAEIAQLLLTFKWKSEQTHHHQSLTISDASDENSITISQGLPAPIFSVSLLNTDLTDVTVFQMYNINAI